MDKKLEKQIVAKGIYEDVIKDNEHFHIIHKLDKICVLPYTISSNGLLDTIGVIKELDILKEKSNYTLISGYVNQDDPTNLVAANRLVFEIIGSNIKGADAWMYLGKLTNISGGENMIYCVNLTKVDINNSEEVEEVKKAKKFEMINANKVVGSDDALFLASYMRLFNYFYVNSIS